VDDKTQKAVDKIVNQLIKKYKPEKIILFGSAASGKMRRFSDLDFLLVKKDVPKYGYQRMREVRNLVDRVGYPVDFLVYKPEEFYRLLEWGEPLINSAMKKGKVLYGG